MADPFRPPPEPWLPGNRGIEYRTEVGEPIHAIGSGIVAFAGLVAGRSIVTIDHPDGLRSSYVGLAGFAVGRGSAIEAGEVVGLASEHFHLGVRRGDRYLDPASLWGTRVGAGRVVLVPDGTEAGPTPGQRAAPRSGVARARARVGLLSAILGGSANSP